MLVANPTRRIERCRFGKILDAVENAVGKMKRDFGDILNQWEKSCGNESHATFDKDSQREKFDEREKMRDSEYVKKLQPQDTIDLHGLTQDEARKALDDFVANSKRRGLRKILVIHGKGIHSGAGDGVLSGLVRKFIESDKRLGQFGHADKTMGGSGATWVVVRQ